MDEPTVDVASLTRQAWESAQSVQTTIRRRYEVGLESQEPLSRSVSDLEYMNQNWVLPRTTHTRGRVRGRIKALAARLVFGVLGDYMDAEREFLASLVRVVNDMSQALTIEGDRFKNSIEYVRVLAEKVEVMHDHLEQRVGLVESRLRNH